MLPLPPGTILQLMYLKERISKLKPGSFIEVGPGSGEVSNVLLKKGWRGYAYDLEPETILRLQERFKAEINKGNYHASTKDFFDLNPNLIEGVDLIISSMVIEHLPDELESRFMEKSSLLLNKGGRMIGLVPSSPNHWGIEDEIAGHFRRYDIECLKSLMEAVNYDLIHTKGLTFPISNFLLPISNYLVRKSESVKIGLSNLEKTKHSGIRDVSFKTKFPSFFGIFLNEIFLLPFYWFQKIPFFTSKSLVLFFEVKPNLEKH